MSESGPISEAGAASPPLQRKRCGGSESTSGCEVMQLGSDGCGSDPGPRACYFPACAGHEPSGGEDRSPGWSRCGRGQAWEHCSPGLGTWVRLTGPPACEHGRLLFGAQLASGLGAGASRAAQGPPSPGGQGWRMPGDAIRACGPVTRMGQDRGQVPSCEQALGQMQVGLQLSSPGGEGENGSFWSPSHTLSPVPGIFHGPPWHPLSH